MNKATGSDKQVQLILRCTDFFFLNVLIIFIDLIMKSTCNVCYHTGQSVVSVAS